MLTEKELLSRFALKDQDEEEQDMPLDDSDDATLSGEDGEEEEDEDGNDSWEKEA